MYFSIFFSYPKRKEFCEIVGFYIIILSAQFLIEVYLSLYQTAKGHRSGSAGVSSRAHQWAPSDLQSDMHTDSCSADWPVTPDQKDLSRPLYDMYYISWSRESGRTATNRAKDGRSAPRRGPRSLCRACAAVCRACAEFDATHQTASADLTLNEVGVWKGMRHTYVPRERGEWISAERLWEEIHVYSVGKRSNYGRGVQFCLLIQNRVKCMFHVMTKSSDTC